MQRFKLKLPKINPSRVYLDRFAKRAGGALVDGALVLDAGAGDCLYQHHFAHGVYESADLCTVDKPYGNITYNCDLTDIPVESGRFDMVFCTQTLEHLPEPQQALTELARILKPNGTLWLTAPLYFEEHEVPYDFYRYTQFGLTHLLTTSGFKVDEMGSLEGFNGTLSHQLKVASRLLALKPSAYGNVVVGSIMLIPIAFLKVMFALLSIVFAWLELHGDSHVEGMCKNYTVVATKC